MNCVNINNPEFKKLLEESKLSSLELETFISNWQDKVKLDRFPSLNEIFTNDLELTKKEMLVDLQRSIIPKKTSDIGLSILSKDISKANDRLKHQGIQRVYKIENKVRIGQSADFTFDVKVYRGNLNTEDKNNRKLYSLPTNQINAGIKSIDILQSPKADEVFRKGDKNGWTVDKMLQELQVPKEQQELIKSFNTRNREEILTSLLANYSYTVEINTSKVPKNYDFSKQEVIDPETGDVYSGHNAGKPNENTQYYSNLTVNEDFYKNNPDWEYKEQRITTPLITPSIKGHAQFAEANDIGWFRAWYNKKTGEVHVLEVQSDLFQKGRDKKDLILKQREDSLYNGIKQETTQDLYKEAKSKGKEVFAYHDYYYLYSNKYYSYSTINNKYYVSENKSKENTSENQFLQLLNKDNNWVTVFVKSIIQDSAKQTITEVQQEDVEAKIRELEKEGLLEIDCKGKLKAEKGLATTFTKGGKWKVIKDLKGYPTHKEGGIDLTIGKDGVNIKNGNTQFTAKHGLVIPKN